MSRGPRPNIRIEVRPATTVGSGYWVVPLHVVPLCDRPDGRVLPEENDVFRQWIEAGVVGDDRYRALLAAVFEQVFRRPINPTEFPFYDFEVPAHAHPH